MREVFGERGIPNEGAARAIKPTEVGDGAKRQTNRKRLRTQGDIRSPPLPMWGRVWGTPKKFNSRHLQRRLVLEKRFERHHREAPFHQFDLIRRVPTTV
jgi:hypothetical protein